MRPTDTNATTADVNTGAANTDEHTQTTTNGDKHAGAAYACATIANTDRTAISSATDADTDTITISITVSRFDLGQ